VDETLSSLSMKAGLPPDAWKEGASFKVFESVVLSE
jgi:AMMECR1 domain-containing protein